VRQYLQRHWVQAAVVAASLIFFLWLLYQLRNPLTPFAVAFALAYILNPLANWLQSVFSRVLPRVPVVGDRIPPRTAAVGVLAVLLVVVLVATLAFVVPALYHQISETVAKVPEYLKVLRAKVEPIYQRLNLQYPEQTEEARERLAAAAKANIPQLLSPVTRVLSKAFSSLMGFVLAVLNLVIIPVFAFYLLYDMNRIRLGAKDLVPVRYRPYAYSRLAEVDRLLSAFVRGQLTVAVILGAFYSVGLTLCGVPMGLLVGFVIGLFNLVPFMSYILGLPLALILSWLDDQDPTRLLAVIGVFALGQFLEGNFVTPRIVGGSLGLHAVIIMLAVLVGGTTFGFVGMVLAVPATAALSVFWKDMRDWYLRSQFYRGPADDVQPGPAPPGGVIRPGSIEDPTGSGA
jgi:predicted PurR-regulated permease PerM